MTRHYAFRVLGLLLLSPAMFLGQIPQPNFNAFFAQFKAAVEQRDAARLTTLMAPGFNFIRARNVSPADVFKGLDADNGLQWTNLQQAVQGQPAPYQIQGSNAHARILQCTPTQPIYSCLVIFQQDSHQHWRWKSMIMPTR